MPKRKLTVAKQQEKKLRKRREKVRKLPVPRPEIAVKRFERGLQDVLRALKKAKSFERQRLAKRIITETKASEKWKKKQAKRKSGSTAADGKDGDRPDGAAQKIERLQREMQVLKILDLEVAARVHLANCMLRTKDIVEAPGPLAAHLQAIAELPTDKKQRGDAADVHNVTSALYNRTDVREKVSKAVTGVCLLLCVPIPERYQREEWTKEERKNIKSGKADDDDDELEIIDGTSDEDESDSVSGEDEAEAEKEEKEGGEEEGDDAEPDTDAEERALDRFEARLGGLSEDDDSEDEDLETLRAKYKKALAEGPVEADESEEDEEDEEDLEMSEEDEEGIEEGVDFYVDEGPSRKIGVASSESGSDEDDLESDSDSDSDSDGTDDSDEDAVEPPRKRRATAVLPAKDNRAAAADSRFLPTLMGGYVSDGGSSDGGRRDDDDAAATRMLAQRKNRRGQRARQAIWEKKYKEQARHVKEAGQAQAGSAKTGWDAKRGAVGADEGPRWLRRKLGRQTGGGGGAKKTGDMTAAAAATGSRKETKRSKDDAGPLHPSWEAAKAAKEKAQTATFTGKKITFD
ncbi:cellular morphogenesis protein [Grosmannia clavigera kw1407]|uniref:Cellular morphogenesis protein n=1 Tax=Grosmannia clavigera (strain kw1407 / UAMH 11150) TaxID=655863 RepID=F0XQI9_GROCL|nr:cellular morphogenesis protein [Grosmannia clavigera kw1407]EFX00561.1 cellular morphogenesis protein [Grosmannia clavigera kw1407]